MRQIISLAKLREKHPDDWKESILTLCEWSPHVEGQLSWNGNIGYHQATVITVGKRRIIKFWCDEHLNEASDYEKYG